MERQRGLTLLYEDPSLSQYFAIQSLSLLVNLRPVSLHCFLSLTTYSARSDTS